MAKSYIEVELNDFRKALEKIARASDKKSASELRAIAIAALENSFEGYNK